MTKKKLARNKSVVEPEVTSVNASSNIEHNNLSQRHCFKRRSLSETDRDRYVADTEADDHVADGENDSVEHSSPQSTDNSSGESGGVVCRQLDESENAIGNCSKRSHHERVDSEDEREPTKMERPAGDHQRQTFLTVWKKFQNQIKLQKKSTKSDDKRVCPNESDDCQSGMISKIGVGSNWSNDRTEECETMEGKKETNTTHQVRETSEHCRNKYGKDLKNRSDTSLRGTSSFHSFEGASVCASPDDRCNSSRRRAFSSSYTSSGKSDATKTDCDDIDWDADAFTCSSQGSFTSLDLLELQESLGGPPKRGRSVGLSQYSVASTAFTNLSQLDNLTCYSDSEICIDDESELNLAKQEALASHIRRPVSLDRANFNTNLIPITEDF